MVVNKKGGKKGKKFARKNANRGPKQFNGKVRKSECSEEIYAGVTKILGNGRVEIKCNDGEIRHCVIRKNFRGKGKRDNEVTKDSIILAGIREWATKNKEKTEVCDLLYVYDGGQINVLKMDPDVNIAMLLSEVGKKNIPPEEEIEFFDTGVSGNTEDDGNTEEEEEEEAESPTPKTTIVEINDDEEVNVDDI